MANFNELKALKADELRQKIANEKNRRNIQKLKFEKQITNEAYKKEKEEALKKLQFKRNLIQATNFNYSELSKLINNTSINIDINDLNNYRIYLYKTNKQASKQLGNFIRFYKNNKSKVTHFSILHNPSKLEEKIREYTFKIKGEHPHLYNLLNEFFRTFDPSFLHHPISYDHLNLYRMNSSEYKNVTYAQFIFLMLHKRLNPP